MLTDNTYCIFFIVVVIVLIMVRRYKCLIVIINTCHIFENLRKGTNLPGIDTTYVQRTEKDIVYQKEGI